MSNSIDLILRVKADNTGVFVQVADKIEKIGEAASKTDAKLKGASGGFRAFASNLDDASSKARVGLSAIAQLGDMAGLKLSGMIMPAAQAADAIGDLAHSMQNVSKGTLIAVGAIGLAVAAFVALDSVMQSRNREIADGILLNDEWARSMERAAQGSEIATAKLREMTIALAQAQTGWSWDIGDVVQRWMEFDQVGRGAAQALHLLGIEANDLHPALETSAQKAARLKDELSKMLFAAGSAGAALRTLKADAEALVGVEQNGVRVMTAWTARERVMLDQFWRLNPAARTAANSLANWHAELDKKDKVTSYAQTVNALADKLRGLVENALAPTAVDPNMGEAWDEARKRFEAFASGTDIGAYGEEFKKMFESLGMSAADAAAKFKDFSLFVDPANIKLVNFAPIIADIEQQLLSMAGKANLTSAAMKEVWANLSPTAKAALAEQGIDNTKEAIEALLNPTGAARQKVDELSNSIKDVPTAVTTLFHIVKSDTWDQTLKDILADIAKIPTEITIPVSMENNLPSTEATTPPPPPSGGGIPKFAEGGIMSRTGYAYLHAGERVLSPQETKNYHMGGNTINITLPNVRGASDARSLVNEINRLIGRGARLRAAQGLR